MIVMLDASEVDFTKEMKSFMTAGKAIRMVCGKMILFRTCPCVMPKESAASHCPLGMERIAPRMDSAE
ncbi:hypothetical protein D3C74_482940 [compost metagenome]